MLILKKTCDCDREGLLKKFEFEFEFECVLQLVDNKIETGILFIHPNNVIWSVENLNLE